MIRIKVCGLTDPRNVREIADAGADFLGFIFYKGSKRYVGDLPAKGLFRRLPGQARKVGVFVNEDPEKVIEIANRLNLPAVQLHGQEPATYCQAIRQAGKNVIKAFGVGDDFDFGSLAPYMDVCDFFLFDAHTGHHGGSGVKFPWRKLRDYNLDKPFFLSGGIGPEDVHTIRGFSHAALYAADINSRFEIAPGVKDTRMIEVFIQDIKTKMS